MNSINIHDSVKSIGEYAFENSGLTSIFIPQSINDIGNGVFKSCSKLETINVSVENKAYISKDGVLFSCDITELIVCPQLKKGRYSIPYGVEKIAKYAFCH